MAQHTGTHVLWNEEEWEEFATLLDRENPGDGFLHSVDLATLSCRALSSAGEKMQRPRTFFNLAGPRAKLLEAYARLRAKNGIAVSAHAAPPALLDTDEEDSRTRWTAEEWDDFAEVLHEDNPRAGFMDSPDLATLTVPDLNNAAAQMGRPRHFSSIGRAPKKLMEAYARLRAKRLVAAPAQESTPPPEQEASQKAKPASGPRRAPPPAPPPSPLKLDAAGRPLPVPLEQRRKPETEPTPFAAVAWDRNEWLAIATEIDRMYPLSKYPEREHLTGLTSEDVAFAQRILPVERHIRHIKVASFSTLAPALKEAFEDLRRQRRTADIEHGVVAEAERNAKKVLDKAAAAQPQAQAKPAPETMVPAAIPTLAAVPAAMAPAADPVQAALSLLLGHALGLLTERLRPMIAELIDQALLAPVPAPAAGAVQAALPSDASAPAVAPVATPATKVEKAPRMRIGIVGSHNSAYLNSLSRDFPSIEFRWIDNVKEAETVKNCNPVFVITKFCSHSLRDQVLKKISRNQYMPINGSLSDLRRVITGLLNEPRAQSQQAIAVFAT